MHKFLDLDFRAIQTELRTREFVRSSEALGPTESIFRTSEHGYRRINGATFLHIMNFETGRPYSLTMARPNLVCIQITISGAYSRWIEDRVDHVTPATIQVTNVPLSISDTQAGRKLRGILIACEREHLLDHFKLRPDQIPSAYKPIFTSRVGSLAALKLPSSPEVMTAADQILSCKYHEPLRHIYITAKSTEIICGVVSQINGLSTQTTERASLAQIRTHAIETAAKIYKREVHNPPTIEQLALRVGLNKNELTSGFRELFGATPHAYGHMLRMEQAEHLLRSGQLSISEVARRVGYEGYSSFSRAYRAHYGQTPSGSKPEQDE